MEDTTQIVNLKPPTAQNLQNSIKWTKFEPPRAHKFFKFNARTDAEQNGLNFDRNHSNLRNWNNYDSSTIARTQIQFSPPICQESHDSLQYPTLICRGVQIRRSCC